MFPFFSCLRPFVTGLDQELGQPGLIDISCVDGHTDKVVYRYPHSDKQKLEPLQYVARDLVYGDLEQNMKIDGTGDCYELFVRFR